MPKTAPTPRRQRIVGPPLTRQAEIQGIDTGEERRIRVSFSSEHPVLRASLWDEPWIEILGHEKDEIDLARIDAGAAPVLYNHSRWESSDRLGRVEKAWLENNRAYAEIRFSNRAEVDPIWQDIRDGILTNVSVGYEINERTLTKANKDGPDEYRVTRWTPMEISMVDIPADHTVGLGRAASTEDAYRIQDIQTPSSPQPAETANVKDDTATPEQQTQPAPETERAQANTVALDQARSEGERAALERDRTRRTAIARICDPLRARYPFVAELERNAMTGTQSPEEVSAAILRKMGEGAVPLGADPAPVDHAAGQRFHPGEDQADKTSTAGSEALLARANVRVLTSRDGEKRTIDLNGNPFRGATLLQIAERILRANGIDPDGMDKRALVGRAFQSTSDFPNLLEEAIHKSLLNAYRVTPDTWRRFCKPGTVSDFRAHNRYRTGSIGNFDTLNEHGEFKRKTIPDAEKSTVTATTRGNIVAVTRETIINDDLGALMDLSMNLGRAGARTIEAAVYAALAENSGAGPTMTDGDALFHANHGNIEATTVGVPSVATFEASRILMAQQLDVGANDYLDLRPAVWLGPIGLGGDARVTNDAQYDPDTANKLQRPNKVRGLVRDIVDTPRLSGNPWYLFADPMEAAVLEVAFLDGEDEPYVETQDGWDVDGAELKARLDFGVGVIDFRGAVKNNGA